MLKWSIPFALFIILSGCGNSLVDNWRAPPVVQVEKLSIPADMLSCSPAPVIPSDTAMQSDMADWAVREKAVEIECRSKLDSIKHLQDIDNGHN